MREIDKLDEEILKDPGSDKLLYRAVRLLFNVGPTILDKLDKREVEDIYTFSKKRFAEIEKQRADIVSKSLSSIWQPPRKETKEVIPSRKRPGSKQ